MELPDQPSGYLAVFKPTAICSPINGTFVTISDRPNSLIYS